jgi:hypothetical protein
MEAAERGVDPVVVDVALANRARILAELDPSGEPSDIQLLLSGWKQRDTTIAHEPVLDAAFALAYHGGGESLVAVTERMRIRGPILEAAVAIGHRSYGEAADLLGDMGRLPDEAAARLLAGKKLIADGRRSEGEAELERSLTVWRRAGASAYLAQCEALMQQAESA